MASQSELRISEIRKKLRSLQNPKKAVFLQRFFKTGPGEYAEGDRFLGITVPELRALSKKARKIDLPKIEPLLKSHFHEERVLGFLVLCDRYAQAVRTSDEVLRRKVYRLCMKNRNQINNWDLVDFVAPKIIGPELRKRRTQLYRWSKSKKLWERRISILSTFPYIRDGDYGDTLRIAKTLLLDQEDLIHKAVGWMLREVGKKDFETEDRFLKKHYRKMPRTMLRYAIEKFPEKKRKAYLKGLV